MYVLAGFIVGFDSEKAQRRRCDDRLHRGHINTGMYDRACSIRCPIRSSVAGLSREGRAFQTRSQPMHSAPAVAGGPMHGRPQFFAHLRTAPRDFRRLSQGGRTGLWKSIAFYRPCADDGFRCCNGRPAALALSGATARRHRSARLENCLAVCCGTSPDGEPQAFLHLVACFLCGATQSWGVLARSSRWRPCISISGRFPALFDRDARPTDRRR